MAAALGLPGALVPWLGACFVVFAGAGFFAGAFLTGACSATNGTGVVAAGDSTLFSLPVGAAIEASVPTGTGVSTL